MAQLARGSHPGQRRLETHIAVCIIVCMDFEWDESKNAENIAKHGLSFYEAQDAFFDKSRVILIDKRHSSVETRHFCIGKTANGGIATVRFTLRNGHIRIFGAGYWRKGKKIYEQHS
jgi:uncharacterized DUF497 family protein